jgi:hypothetical protein
MIFVMFMKEHDHEAGVFKMPKATPGIQIFSYQIRQPP